MCLGKCLANGVCEKTVEGYLSSDGKILQYWSRMHDNMGVGLRAYAGDASWKPVGRWKLDISVYERDGYHNPTARRYALKEHHAVEFEMLRIVYEEKGVIYSPSDMSYKISSLLRNGHIYPAMIHNRMQGLYRHHLIIVGDNEVRYGATPVVSGKRITISPEGEKALLSYLTRKA